MYTPGDRVLVSHKVVDWRGYGPEATIVRGPTKSGRPWAAAGEQDDVGYYDIRLDGYDYQLDAWPANSHHAWGSVLSPTQGDQDEAIASILSSNESLRRRCELQPSEAAERPEGVCAP